MGAVSDPVKEAQRDARQAADRAQRLAERKARESTPDALDAKRARLDEIQADLLDNQVAEELARIKAREVAARQRAEADSSGWDLDTDALTITGYDPPVKDLLVTDSCGVVPGKSLAYSCGLHVLFGLPKSGKSWIAAWWAAQELQAGRRVVWVDYDNQRSSLGSRLLMCGATSDQVDDLLTYLRPKGRPDMEKLTTQAAGMLVIIDTLGKLQSHVAPGTSSNDYDAVTVVEQSVLRPLTEAGCTVCVIDHEAKANGSTPFGSVAKSGFADLVWHVTRDGENALLTVNDDRHAPYDDSPVAQFTIKGSQAVLTAEFAQPSAAGTAHRDTKVLTAVTQAPVDFWTTTTLAEQLTATGDAGKSTWAAHIRGMILAGTLGTAPSTGRTAYLRPPSLPKPDPAPLLAKLNQADG